MPIAKPTIIVNADGLIGKLSQPKRLRLPFEVSNSETLRLARVVGSDDMILANMIIDIPLPIPCSVMSSPSHIKRIEPALIAVIDRIHCIVFGSTVAVVLVAKTC